MSREIDERIVQMKFDNRQFEHGVKDTMSTLDKLKTKLHFDDAASGMEQLQLAVNSLSFSNLINSSTLAVEKLFQVHRHLNNIIQSAERTVKSLSIDQVTAGWSKYADKTQAVQTIMAATAKDWEDTGAQMEYVNKQLAKLNWFTDETSYDFLAMTNNIGKFTSNGVKLEDAVTAMEGISDWAAISGAGTESAARAMYNLSQAMAVGSVKLIDWRSIENANMATLEFKENVIDVALELGTLKKAADGTIYSGGNIEHVVSAKNFNEQLKDQWFSADVLTTVLKRYGGFTDKLHEYINEIDEAGKNITTSTLLEYAEDFSNGTLKMDKAVRSTGLTAERLTEILTELNKNEYDLGRRSFKAAQEAKTFKEALDATKDAVSTGWMNTFEIIFGDYLKAKELWTAVANELYDIFALGGERRNAILEEWADFDTEIVDEISGEAMKARDALLGAVGNIWGSFTHVLNTFRDARDELFAESDVAEWLGRISESLYRTTSRFRSFVEQFEISEEVASGFKQTLNNIVSGLKNIAGPILLVLAKTHPFLGTAIKIGTAIYTAFKNSESFVGTLSSLGHIVQSVSLIFERLSRIVDALFGTVTTLLTNVLSTPIFDAISTVVDKVAVGVDKIANIFVKKQTLKETAAISEGVNDVSESANDLSDTSEKTKSLWSEMVNAFSRGSHELEEASERQAAAAKSTAKKVVRTYDKSASDLEHTAEDIPEMTDALYGDPGSLQNQWTVGQFNRMVRGTVEETTKQIAKIPKLGDQMFENRRWFDIDTADDYGTNMFGTMEEAAKELENTSKDIRVGDLFSGFFDGVDTAESGIHAVADIIRSIQLPPWLQGIQHFIANVVDKIANAIGWVREKLSAIPIPQWMLDVGSFFHDLLVPESKDIAEAVEDMVDDIPGASIVATGAKKYKDLYDAVMETIRGDYGNGEERDAKFLELGYSDELIQGSVNKVWSKYGDWLDGAQEYLETLRGVNAYAEDASTEGIESTVEASAEAAKSTEKQVSKFSDYAKKWRAQLIVNLPAIAYNAGVLWRKANDAIGKGIDLFDEYLGKAITKVKSVWTNNVEPWLNKVKSFIERVKNLGNLNLLEGDSIFANIKRVFNYLVNGVDEFGVPMANTEASLISLRDRLANDFNSIVETIKSIPEKLKNAWNKLKDIWSKITGFMDRLLNLGNVKFFNLLRGKSLIRAIADYLRGVENPYMYFADEHESLADKLSKVFDKIKSISETIKNTISSIYEKVQSVWNTIWSFSDKAKDNTPSHPLFLGGIADSNTLDKIDTSQFTTIGERISAAVDGVRTTIETATTRLSGLGDLKLVESDSIFANIRRVFNYLVNGVDDFSIPMEGSSEPLISLRDKLKNGFDSVVEVLQSIPDRIENAWNRIKDIWAKITGFMDRLLNLGNVKFSDALHGSSFIQAISDYLMGVENPYMYFVEGHETLADKLGSIWESIKSIADKISGLWDKIKSVVQIVKDTISNIFEKIQGVWNSIYDPLGTKKKPESPPLFLNGIADANTLAKLDTDKFTTIGERIASTIDNVRNKIQSAIDTLIGWWNTIRGGIRSIFGGIISIFFGSEDENDVEQLESLSSNVKNASNTVRSVFSLLSDTVATLTGSNPLEEDNEKTGSSIETLKRIIDVLKNIFGTIRKVISSIASFIETAWPVVSGALVSIWNFLSSTLYKIGSTVYNFFDVYGDSIKEKGRTFFTNIREFLIDNWPDIKSTIASIFHGISSVVGGIFNFLKRLFAIKDLTIDPSSGPFGVIKDIFDYLTGQKEIGAMTRSTESLTTVGSMIGGAISKIADRFRSLFEILSVIFGKIKSFFKENGPAIKQVGSSFISAVGSVLSPLGKIVGGIFEHLINAYEDGKFDIDNIEFGTLFIDIANKVKRAVDTLKRTFSSIFEGVSDFFGDGFGFISLTIQTLFNETSDEIQNRPQAIPKNRPQQTIELISSSLLGGNPFAEGLTSILGNTEEMPSVMSKANGILSRVSDEVTTAEGTSDNILNTTSRLSYILGSISTVLQGFAIVGVLRSAKKLIKSFTKMTNVASTALDNIQHRLTKGTTFKDKFTKIMEALKTIIQSIAILAGIVVVLGMIPPDIFWNGAAKAAIIFGAIIAIVVLIGVFDNMLEKKYSANTTGSHHKGLGRAIAELGIGVLAIAAAMVVLYGACRLFAATDPLVLLKGFGVVALIMAGMVVASKFLGDKGTWQTGVVILAMAVGVRKLIKAIKIAGKIEDNVLWKGLTVVLGLLAGVTFFAKTVGSLDKKAAFLTLTGLAASILLLCIPMKILGSMDTDTLIKGGVTIGALFVALGFAAKMSSGMTTKSVIGIIVLAAVITAIVGTIFAMPYSDKLVVKVISVAGLMLALGVMCAGVAWATKLVQGLSWKDLGLGLAKIAAIIGAIALVIGVIIAALYGLNVATKGKLADVIETTVPIIGALGEFLGAFIGGVFAGAFTQFVRSIHDIDADTLAYSAKVIIGILIACLAMLVVMAWAKKKFNAKLLETAAGGTAGIASMIAILLAVFYAIGALEELGTERDENGNVKGKKRFALSNMLVSSGQVMEQLAKALSSIAVPLVLIMGAIAVLSKLKVNFVSIVGIGGGASLVILMLAGVFAIIGAIANYFSSRDGIEATRSLSGGTGSPISHASKIIEQVSDTLKTIAIPLGVIIGAAGLLAVIVRLLSGGFGFGDAAAFAGSLVIISGGLAAAIGAALSILVGTFVAISNMQDEWRSKTGSSIDPTKLQSDCDALIQIVDTYEKIVDPLRRILLTGQTITGIFAGVGMIIGGVSSIVGGVRGQGSTINGLQVTGTAVLGGIGGAVVGAVTTFLGGTSEAVALRIAIEQMLDIFREVAKIKNVVDQDTINKAGAIFDVLPRAITAIEPLMNNTMGLYGIFDTVGLIVSTVSSAIKGYGNRFATSIATAAGELVQSVVATADIAGAGWSVGFALKQILEPFIDIIATVGNLENADLLHKNTIDNAEKIFNLLPGAVNTLQPLLTHTMGLYGIFDTVGLIVSTISSALKGYGSRFATGLSNAFSEFLQSIVATADIAGAGWSVGFALKQTLGQFIDIIATVGSLENANLLNQGTIDNAEKIFNLLPGAINTLQPLLTHTMGLYGIFDTVGLITSTVSSALSGYKGRFKTSFANSFSEFLQSIVATADIAGAGWSVGFAIKQTLGQFIDIIAAVGGLENADLLHKNTIDNAEKIFNLLPGAINTLQPLLDHTMGLYGIFDTVGFIVSTVSSALKGYGNRFATGVSNAFSEFLQSIIATTDIAGAGWSVGVAIKQTLGQFIDIIAAIGSLENANQLHRNTIDNAEKIFNLLPQAVDILQPLLTHTMGLYGIFDAVGLVTSTVSSAVSGYKGRFRTSFANALSEFLQSIVATADIAGAGWSVGFAIKSILSSFIDIISEIGSLTKTKKINENTINNAGEILALLPIAYDAIEPVFTKILAGYAVFDAVGAIVSTVSSAAKGYGNRVLTSASTALGELGQSVVLTANIAAGGWSMGFAFGQILDSFIDIIGEVGALEINELVNDDVIAHAGEIFGIIPSAINAVKPLYDEAAKAFVKFDSFGAVVGGIAGLFTSETAVGYTATMALNEAAQSALLIGDIAGGGWSIGVAIKNILGAFVDIIGQVGELETGDNWTSSTISSAKKIFNILPDALDAIAPILERADSITDTSDKIGKYIGIVAGGLLGGAIGGDHKFAGIGAEVGYYAGEALDFTASLIESMFATKRAGEDAKTTMQKLVEGIIEIGNIEGYDKLTDEDIQKAGHVFEAINKISDMVSDANITETIEKADATGATESISRSSLLNKNWDQLGIGFSNFADEFVEFYQKIVDEDKNLRIDPDTIVQLEEPITALGRMLQSIPYGADLDVAGAASRWSVLSNGLPEFGTALNLFATNMGTVLTEYDEVASNIDISKTNVLAVLSTELARALCEVVQIDELWSYDEDDISDFEKQVCGISSALASAAASFNEFTVDDVSKVSTASSFISALSSILSDFGILYDKIWDKWGSTDDDFFFGTGNGDGFFDKFASGIATLATTLASTTIENTELVTGISEIASAIDSLATLSFDSETGTFRNINVIKTSVTETAHAIVQSFADATHDATTIVALTSAGNEVALKFSHAITESKTTGSNPRWWWVAREIKDLFVAAVDSFIPEYEAEGASLASKFSNSIVNTMRTKQSEYVDIGANITQGFIDGIRSREAAAVAAAVSVASATIMPFKAIPEVQSPSKVTRGIGAFVSLGYALGIKDNQGLVERSASDVAFGSIDVMREILARSEAMLSEDVEPVISPVIDMSNVDRSIGQIGGLFNSSRFVAGVSLQNAEAIQMQSVANRTKQQRTDSNNFEDIRQELVGLRHDMNTLSEDMSHLQIVMDSGALVGSISGKMDASFARRTVYRDRRN